MLYLGDLDFSGGHIEENTRSVLEQIVDGPLEWERLAVTAEQVTQYNLTVIQKYDKRTKQSHPAVETEALSQTVLVDILRQRLDSLLPEPLEHVHRRADRQREQVMAALRKGDGADR